MKNWRKMLDRVWKGPEQSRSQALQVIRLLWVMLSPEVRNPLLLRATSLAYTTILAMVPLLAVSFSVLKAFGVHHQVRPLLEDFLRPLGPQGQELAGRLVDFVNNVNAGVLGAVGVVFLVYTAISLINKIEDAFNAIWRVREARSFALRLSGYLSLLLMGPVLVFAALGFVSEWLGWLRTWFGDLSGLIGQALPLLLTVAAFWFVYLLLPNTRVAWRPAFWGALAGALGWRLSGVVFARLVAGSARYAAIYSSFVGLILFLVWLQLSWVIFLAGAQLAFYLQHPERLHRPGRPPPGIRAFEAVGLGVLYWVVGRFREGAPPPDDDELETLLNADPELLDAVLSHLEEAGLVTRDIHERWLPAQALEERPVGALWRALRGDLAGADRDGRGLSLPPPVEALLTELEQGGEKAANRSVAAWLAEGQGRVTPFPRRRDE